MAINTGSSSKTNPYLRTKILTANPLELRLMLYEGAIRFGRQAKAAIEKKDFETFYNDLVRAQKIVLELSTSLRPEVAPALCEKLNALYIYIYKRLVDASTNHDASAIEEAIELMGYEKQTWQMLMEQQAQAENDSFQDVAGAQQTAISSLSVNG